MKVDPLLLLGMLTLGMVLGALLTMIRYKRALARIVGEEIDKQRKRSELSAKKDADSQQNEAA